MPFFVRPFAKAIAGRTKSTFIQPQIALHLDFIESELGKHEWFAGGELTAADVAMSFPLEVAAGRAGLDRSRPRSMAFLDRIHARPAYVAALAKGGPFEVLK